MLRFPAPESISRWLISAVFVLLTQLTLVSAHRFFSTLSIQAQLSISAVVLLVTSGIGGWCRRFAGVSASAPAFVVFNILFVWSVYMEVIRQDVSVLMDVTFNIEVSLMIIGLYSMFTSDPGKVTDETSSSSQFAESKNTTLAGRIRFCKSCKTYIKGFDHHCPAFGNCIVAAKPQASLRSRSDGLFLAWHVYCICVNITTDEWVNWTKYQEFWLPIEPEDDPEQYTVIKRFRNPYDKGILQNVKEFFFLTPKQ